MRVRFWSRASPHAFDVGKRCVRHQMFIGARHTHPSFRLSLCVAHTFVVDERSIINYAPLGASRKQSYRESRARVCGRTIYYIYNSHGTLVGLLMGHGGGGLAYDAHAEALLVAQLGRLT